MGIYVIPGNSGFTTIRNSRYIDKSGMITLINAGIDTKSKLTCISRPRRFGKSFAAQMLCAYYDSSCDSSSLFNDLEIAEDPSFGTHLNRYNVIYLDMTNILDETKDDAGQKPFLSFLIRKITEELQQMYPDMQPDEAFSGTLIEAVRCSGKKFVMLIDEWDAPIRETPEFEADYLKFLRMLFKSSGTTDRIFAAAYMTGILPIKKDGSQSAVSDFREYTVLDPGKFAEYIGFTETEVKRLCEDGGLSFEEAQKWYDGYHFPGAEPIYNPYSIMCVMESGVFRSYWKKTSAAESLRTYIDMDEEGLQDDVARLISGESIEVRTDGFENDVQTFRDKDDVLTLLIHLGYLTWQEEEESGFARIPNEEIRMEFNGMLRKGKHPELIRLVRMSDQLLEKTLAGEEEAVAQAIAAVHDSGYAPQYYNNEQALRSTIRLAYLSCVDRYVKIEELPSGHGVADIVFLPGKRSLLPAMILELKWNRTEDAAIAQIRKNNYPAVLRNFGGEIVLAGINYDAKTKKHTCRIEKIRNEC